MDNNAPGGLSDRFKLAFKLGLAMVMTYGFALWFNWDKPYWATFAVALISMSTLGESLAKGGQRLWGTLAAVPVSLSIIALFPQDRWLFLLALVSWLALCTYRMSSGRGAYFWFCAGFVTAIIAANGGADPVDAFSLAVIRALETALGIACYALVFSLLWPVHKVKEEPARKSPAPPQQVFPDLDRLQQTTRVVITYCVGFLLVIYVPGLPGGYGFLGMLAPFAILLANTPQLSAKTLLMPVLMSILLAAPIYMLVMPLLDGFVQLAVVIFAANFLICYFLHQPQQQLGRTFGLAFFAIVTGITNEQTYSFLSVATTLLMCGQLLLLLTLTASLPVSNQPEKVFLRLVRRFFRSATYLSQASVAGDSLYGRYIGAYHRYEIQSIPGKIKTWRARIPATIAEPLAAEMEVLLTHIDSTSETLLQDTDKTGLAALDSMKADYASMDFSNFGQARF